MEALVVAPEPTRAGAIVEECFRSAHERYRKALRRRCRGWDQATRMTTEYPDKPRVAVGALVMHEGRVLVVERGNAPAKGIWALPGGSVELGETLAEAVEREVLEETGLVVRADGIVHTFDAVVRDDDQRVRFHYVIVDLACEYLRGEVVAGGDALAARFVTREEFATLRSSRATIDLLRRITGFFGEDGPAPLRVSAAASPHTDPSPCADASPHADRSSQADRSPQSDASRPTDARMQGSDATGRLDSPSRRT